MKKKMMMVNNLMFLKFIKGYNKSQTIIYFDFPIKPNREKVNNFQFLLKPNLIGK